MVIRLRKKRPGTGPTPPGGPESRGGEYSNRDDDRKTGTATGAASRALFFLLPPILWCEARADAIR